MLIFIAFLQFCKFLLHLTSRCGIMQLQGAVSCINRIIANNSNICNNNLTRKMEDKKMLHFTAGALRKDSAVMALCYIRSIHPFKAATKNHEIKRGIIEKYD